MFKQYRQRRIRSRACYWLTRISGGEVTEKELQRFNHWLSLNPEHREVSLSVAAVWSELGLIKSDVLSRYPLRELLPEAREKSTDNTTKTASNPLSNLYWLSGAGVASVLLIAFLTFTWNTSTPESLQYASMIGEVKRIDMQDGSIIELGPKSNILVSYDETARKVRLINGEAFFNVAKDAKRPFIVSAMGGKMTAVGTAFNVHRGRAEVTVTVHEGRVNVEKVEATRKLDTPGKAEQRLLDAGQETSFGQITGIAEVESVDLKQRSLWRDRRMLFNDKPLDDVVNDLNRYNTLQVYIADNRVKGIKVNGSFKFDQTKVLLEAIEKTLPVRVEMPSDEMAVLFYQAKGKDD